MPRLPSSVAVLQQREYRLLFAGQAVSLLGDGMMRVALPFAALEAGGSVSDVGLVAACRSLPLVAALLAGGVIADRLSRRAVMVAADLVRLATQGVLAGLLIGGVADVWMLAALGGLGGVASGLFNPASTGLLPNIVAPEHLQQANGLRGTAQAAGEIGGPVLAGLLVASLGAGWALAVDAVTFAVSAGLLVRLRVPARARREASSFIAELRAGWAEFTARRWVWSVVASFAVGNLIWAAWSALGPVVADRELGGAEAWGAVLAALGVGGLVGGVLAVRAPPRRPLVVVAATSLPFVAPLALLAAGAPVPVLALGSFAAGVAMILGNAVFESTLQRHIPAASLSRVSAYDWFGSLAFFPLGLAIWGPLAEGMGIAEALWLAAVLQLVAALALLALPDIRHLRNESARNEPG